MLTIELRKRFDSELRKARIEVAQTDAPTAYDSGTNDTFRAAMRLMKLAHADRPALLKMQAVGGALTFGDVVVKRRVPAKADDSQRYVGIGGLSQPANFEKALQATQKALARPKTMIPNMRGTMR